ncbi:hypothetical protein [Deinococcus peraridilitoris]|uniref:Uncharacterized protein n=1 Tax=Deinococcus peraridilitoris (strain DSM 19664 / LMG 22246 / CIP 109416 / KR-200) TaxID=937777 RepID=L0A7D2_DEIPD|nr:hypothetical protein [Deinococcus peraridilitoris]AFZ69773.1 hypothetical protein Deipe_4445 [Deinococcus peraridilitoris DSM 19664]
MTQLRRQPKPGLIYQHGEGEGFTRLTLNANLTITIEQGSTTRTLEVASLKDILPTWAQRCYQATRGELTGLKLGEVGKRMARKYAEKTGALGAPRAAKMHHQLQKLGIPARAHYELCSQVLGRPVLSLATLTEDEARRAWYYARHEYTSRNRA